MRKHQTRRVGVRPTLPKSFAHSCDRRFDGRSIGGNVAYGKHSTALGQVRVGRVGLCRRSAPTRTTSPGTGNWRGWAARRLRWHWQPLLTHQHRGVVQWHGDAGRSRGRAWRWPSASRVISTRQVRMLRACALGLDRLGASRMSAFRCKPISFRQGISNIATIAIDSNYGYLTCHQEGKIGARHDRPHEEGVLRPTA